MRVLMLLLLAVLLCAPTYGQEIEKDEIDIYLKTRKITTTEERLGNSHLRAYKYRIKSYGDSTISIEFSVTLLKPFTVREGQQAFFLFDDSTSIPLSCTRGSVYTRSAYNRYNPTYYTCYPLYDIPADMLPYFRTRLVTGVRIYYDDTYVSMDRIKENHAEVFRKAIRIVRKRLRSQV